MRIGLLMLLDALLISASLLMGLQVYYDMHAPAAHILHVWRSLPLLIVSTIALLHMMGFYRGILKYAGVDLLLQIACGTLGGTGITYLVSFLCYSIRRRTEHLPHAAPGLPCAVAAADGDACGKPVRHQSRAGRRMGRTSSPRQRQGTARDGRWRRLGGAQVIRDMQAGR